MENFQYQMNSKIGTLFLTASNKGLTGIYWDQQAVPMVKTLDRTVPAQKILAQTVCQLTEYFAGQRKEFDIPLDVEQGTPFQRKVWAQLSKIPFGTTLSYRDVAVRIKNPKAVRAVGSANGKNPVSIIVPCHRVIAADGTIGGYGGGISVKEKLLALEQN